LNSRVLMQDSRLLGLLIDPMKFIFYILNG
jgi:hypothetical protein